MDLRNFPEIINFLKNSAAVFQDSGNEFITHCPYCDDALRPNARSHGHLYISKSNPVFHCFRCEASGHLGTLLRDLGFRDEELLRELGTSKYLNVRERSVIGRKQEKTAHDVILDRNRRFKIGNRGEYIKFRKYVSGRLGNYCDFSKYLITPEIINKQLCASFYNSDGKFTTARILEPTNNYRYIRSKDVSELYYFQELDFDQYKNIVITEGVFDCIKLYRFSDHFPKDETFYVAILGKNYPRTVNWLLTTQIPIGEYDINLVFDNDNKMYKKTMSICRKIGGRINKKVPINGYKPVLLNDAGEYPFLEKI